MADLEIAVVPRAAVDTVGPYVEGTLRVGVTRPPAEGEANRAIIRLVARALDVPPSTLELVAGARSRRKRIRVSGLAEGELRRRLEGIGPD
jgi:uncharacterized protein YggU (UPF0235/DUF167 family)